MRTESGPNALGEDAGQPPHVDDQQRNAERLRRLLASPDSHLEGLLALTGLAASDGQISAALQFADRARRLDPGSTILARLCARLLN